MKVKSLSHVQLFVTPWTVALQAPPSMGFSRQHYWSGLPFPSPGDLPDPGIEPRSPALQAEALTSEPPNDLLPSSMILLKLFELVTAINKNQIYSNVLFQPHRDKKPRRDKETPLLSLRRS